MDGRRLAREFQALRRHRRLSQAAVGARAGVSRSMVSRIEVASVRGLRLGALMDVADVLGAELDLRLRWQGERLDRLLDRAHALLVEAVTTLLATCGWEVWVEATYSEWGERGSIDVLAFQRATGTLLVIEVKSVIPDAQALLAGLDRKARLAGRVAAARGWRATSVATLLIVGESTTARRRVRELDVTFGVALPDRGRTVTRWLRRPAGSLRGLLFLPSAHGRDQRQRPRPPGGRSGGVGRRVV
jgi:transcriptional regulator with XRE-family HTH domain